MWPSSYGSEEEEDDAEVSISELDTIRVLLETNLLGSTVLLVGAALVLPFLMLLVARIPPFFTFLILSPAFLAFGQAGLLPQWIVAGTWIVFALFWVFVTRLVYQQN